MVPNYIGTKKILVPNYIGIKKILVPNYFGSKNILVPNYIGTNILLMTNYIRDLGSLVAVIYFRSDRQVNMYDYNNDISQL